MKNIFLNLLVLTALVSCGPKDPDFAAAETQKVKLNTVASLRVSLADYSIKPDTLTMFFLPVAGQMNWVSNSFNLGDSDLDKWGDIMKDVIISSDNIDKVNLLKMEFESKLCFEDDTTAECIEIQNKFATYGTDYYSSETYVGSQLAVIQKAVDDCIVDGSIRESRQLNWLNYGDDVKKFKIDLTDLDNPIIYFKQLGSSALQKYKSEDGDIINIRYERSEYAPNTMMLRFSLREKDENGDYNGNTWDVDLEQMSFAGKIRFKGDVLKYNASGVQIQRGIMKVELPAKEE